MRLRSRPIVIGAALLALGSISPAQAAVAPVIDACSTTGSGDLRLAPATGCSPVLETAVQLLGAGDAYGLECPGCVDASDIASGAVGASHVATDAIGSAEIADGAVAEADLAFDPITQGEADAANHRLLSGPTPVTTLDTGLTFGKRMDATVGTDGLPVIAYTRGTQLWVARCATRSCASASRAQIPNVTAQSTSAPSIAIGSDGLPVVAIGVNLTIGVIHCDVPDCSASTTTLLQTSNNAQYAALAINADGLPVVGYRDNGLNAFMLARCANVACTPPLISVQNMDPSSVSGGFTPSIALGADGLLVASHYDQGPHDLRVARCLNVACTSVASVLADGASSSVGTWTSLAVGEDGLPVISYWDTAIQGLKLLHCRTITCAAGGTIVPVVSSVDVSYVSGSTTIGVDGRPIVAVSTADGVRLLRCGDFDCSGTGANTVATIDTAGRYSTAVTLDADGRPLVVYLAGAGSSNLQMRAARCTNAFCLPHFRRR